MPPLHRQCHPLVGADAGSPEGRSGECRPTSKVGAAGGKQAPTLAPRSCHPLIGTMAVIAACMHSCIAVLLLSWTLVLSRPTSCSLKAYGSPLFGPLHLVFGALTSTGQRSKKSQKESSPWVLVLRQAATLEAREKALGEREWERELMKPE